ncbi:MAG: hypothetical protein ACJARP_000557 [Vicingaceae bacterium]|jgi:hypothetical protein
MKTIKSILLIALFAFAITTSAQKIEEVQLQYEYTQQPKAPLEGLKSYSFTVTTPYPENHDGLVAYAKKTHADKVASHPETIEEARKVHEARIADYDHEVTLAQENFKLETEAFDKLNALEKLALEERRPKIKMPRKPGVFVAPSEPVYREPNTSTAIIFKAGQLEDTFLKLEGFEKGTDNALIGTIVMEAFDSGDTERKESTKRVYNSSTKQYVNQKIYTFETPVKRPTRLTLEHNGQTVYNDIFEGTGTYTAMTSKSSPNLYQMEKDNVSDILRNINTFVNEQHGFVQIPASLTIRAPKNKGDYNDLEKAAKLVKRGVNPMGSSDGKAELKEAIEIWKKALGESDTNDKKARINSKVTQSIYQNLIETCIFKEEFVEAQDYLVPLSEMDLKNSEERWVESTTAAIEARLEK